MHVDGKIITYLMCESSKSAPPPGPTAAAAVALTVRAAPPPGPTAAAVALTVRAAPDPSAGGPGSYIWNIYIHIIIL